LREISYLLFDSSGLAQTLTSLATLSRVDHLSKAKRSAAMRRIAAFNTEPEKAVYGMVRSLIGYARRNATSLPGRPDIAVFAKRKAIFVHGCFWHQHRGCSRSSRPKSNVSYWHPKLDRNVTRDLENVRALRKLGWMSMVIWECQLRNMALVKRRLTRFLK
jgi:DNA mismatch endonuclease (patch repair protein)